ncbi:MAG: hypothetical protein NZ933_08930 [Bacteroidia bacterium]|nr:hypothetical protein [Bacteroidia bacterium]
MKWLGMWVVWVLGAQLGLPRVCTEERSDSRKGLVTHALTDSIWGLRGYLQEAEGSAALLPIEGKITEFIYPSALCKIPHIADIQSDPDRNTKGDEKDQA